MTHETKGLAPSKSALFIATALAIHFPQVTLASDTVLVEPPRCLACQQVVAREILRTSPDPKAVAALYAARAFPTSSAPLEPIRDLTQRYQETRDAFGDFRLTVKATHLAVDAGQAYFKLPDLVGVASSRAFEYGYYRLDQAERNATQTLTLGFLSSRQADQQARIQRLNTLLKGDVSPGDLRPLVQDALSDLNPDGMIQMSDGDRSFVVASVLERIVELHQKQGDLQSIEDEEQDLEIEEAMTGLAEVKKSLDNLGRTVDELKRSNDSLLSALDQIQGSGGLGERDSKMLMEVLWGNMTPSQRRAALEDEDFTKRIGLSAEKKKELSSSLDAYLDAEKTLGRLNESISIAGSSIKILNAFGVVDAATSQKLNQGLMAAQGLVSMYAGYPTNPALMLNGAATVLSAFGAAQPDPSAQMFSQVLQEINQLRNEIRQNHLQVMDALGQINQRLSEQHFELVQLEAATQFKIAELGDAIGEGLRENLEACESLRSSWHEWDEQALSWEARREAFESTAQHFARDCYESSSEIFRTLGGVRPSAAFNAWEGSDGGGSIAESKKQFEAWRAGVYGPTLNYSLSNVPWIDASTASLGDSSLLYAYSTPLLTRPSAKEASDRAATSLANHSFKGFSVARGPGKSAMLDSAKSWHSPLSADVITQFAYIMVDVAPIFDLVSKPSSNPTLRTIEELKSPDRITGRPVSQQLLLPVKSLLDIAIAQQQIIAGGHHSIEIAGFLDGRIEPPPGEGAVDPKVSAADETKYSEARDCLSLPQGDASWRSLNAMCLMTVNPALALNVTTAWVDNRLRRNGMTNRYYAASMRAVDGYFLQSALAPAEICNESHEPNSSAKWVVLVPVPKWASISRNSPCNRADRLALPLPEVDALLGQRIHYPRKSFEPLLLARERVVDQLTATTVLNGSDVAPAVFFAASIHEGANRQGKD